VRLAYDELDADGLIKRFLGWHQVTTAAIDYCAYPPPLDKSIRFTQTYPRGHALEPSTSRVCFANEPGSAA